MRMKDIKFIGCELLSGSADTKKGEHVTLVEMHSVKIEAFKS